MRRTSRKRPGNAIYASSNVDRAAFQRFVENLDDMAYDAGFSASGDSPETLKLRPILSEWTLSGGLDFAPTIQLEVVFNSGAYYFLPIIQTPVIYASNLQYADSIQYCFEQYADKLGRFCKDLVNTEYREEDWVDWDEDDI